MAFVLWLPLLVTLHSVPPAAPGPAPASVSFSSWFDARVKEEQPKVEARYKADLDGDGREDDMVCYVFMRTDFPNLQLGGPVTLVGLASGERFVLGPDAGIDSSGSCSTSTLDSTVAGKPTLSMHRAGAGTSSSVTLRFDRKGPMLVGSVVNTRFSSNHMDLLAQRASTSSYTPPSSEDMDSEGDESSWEGVVRVVSELESTTLPSPGQVTWGQKHWKGVEDADLKVSLRRRGEVMVVSVRMQDDKRVAAVDASPKAILAADHVELRWTEWGTTEFMANRQVELGVALDTTGAPVATWFKPPKKKNTPLPSIRWTSPEAVEVSLPIVWFMPTPAKLDYYDPMSATPQLAVFFSDGDGKGQETLVTASDGMLFVADPGRPFPSVAQVVQPWARVEEGATLRSLIP